MTIRPREPRFARANEFAATTAQSPPPRTAATGIGRIKRIADGARGRQDGRAMRGPRSSMIRTSLLEPGRSIPMPTPAVPKVDCERHQPCLSVSDVAAAAEYYTTKLGFTMGFTWGEPPTMAGVNL